MQQTLKFHILRALSPSQRQQLLNRTISIAPYTSSSSSSSTSTSPKCISRTITPKHTSIRPRTLSSRRHASTTSDASRVVRPLVPPPGENSGPLLTRLPNRELPTVSRNPSLFTWLGTIPIFLLIITGSSLAIFNYQKSSSSTVNSILYALRTNPQARELLGDEIYFASKVPWISGELNQLHGVIDIEFWVKGSKGMAKTRFVSVRKRRDGFFETLEWNLKLENGATIQLLDNVNIHDPMAGHA